MACPDFEEVLRQGEGGHAAHCEECGALLDAWADVDRTLEMAFSGVAAPPSMAAAVRGLTRGERQLPRLSFVPEILDFVGWAAVLAIVALLVPRYLPDLLSAVAKLG